MMNPDDTSSTIRMTVAYPDREGARFDLDYYRNHHVPLLAELFASAISRYEVWLGKERRGGGPPAWLVLLHVEFTSRENFEAAFEANGAELVADVPNYTDIEPVVQIEAPGWSWTKTD